MAVGSELRALWAVGLFFSYKIKRLLALEDIYKLDIKGIICPGKIYNN